MSRSAIRCLQYMGSLPRTRRCCCFKQSRSFSYSQKRATVPPFLVCSCCISVWWVKLLRKRGNFFQRLLSVNRTSLLVLIYAFVFFIFFLIPFALFLLYICFVLFFPLTCPFANLGCHLNQCSGMVTPAVGHIRFPAGKATCDRGNKSQTQMQSIAQSPVCGHFSHGTFHLVPADVGFI